MPDSRVKNIEVKNIGVLLPNKKYFGSQIVIAPFLYNLKKIFPHARITGISPRQEISMLCDLGVIDNVMMSELSLGPRAFVNILKRIKKQKFDILFTLRRKSERDWLLNLFSGCGARIGFKRRWSHLVLHYFFDYDKNTYRATNFLKLLGPFSVNPINYASLYTGIACKTSPAIWLVPCGSGRVKLWPVDNYIELARKIILELREKVVFVLGAMEKKYKNNIIEKLQQYSGSISYLIEEPLRTLFGEVNNCMAAVTNDCGPGHIPQIAGCKTIVLFPGRANVNEWVNRKGRSVELVSEKGDISGITVETVFSRLVKEIKGYASSL